MSFHRRTMLLFVALLAFARADFGDYADLTFECPALTTCPTICSSDLADCPTNCPLNATYLCPDGSCQPSASLCDPRTTNACAENACGYPLACPKVVLQYPRCFDEYDPFYERATSCPASSEPAPEISWTLPGFVIFYAWIGAVTFAVLSWCAYNQRIRPVGKARPLHSVPGGGRRKSSYPVLDPEAQAAAMRASRKNQIRDGSNAEGIDGWSQTAYRQSKVGTVIYILVIVTLLGVHGLLATLCSFWYAQRNGYDPSDINPFPNDQQVLIAFECVWLVGFFWSLALKWPASIQALFLRRCEFEEATHVAIFCPSPPARSIHTRNQCVVVLARLLDRLTRATNVVMGALFGERQDLHGTKIFCRVESAEDSNAKYINYQMRRFNFDPSVKCFVPGSFVVGRTLQDLVNCKDGISNEEAATRHSKIGKNTIHLMEPSFLRTTTNEFNKVFYLYQMFMVWTWLNFGYWPMGIVNLGIFVAGGLGVSFVRWMNEKQLYAIAAVSGDVQVKRKDIKQPKTIPQSDIAPGDILSVIPGPVYADMVLIGNSSSTILVDESALTGEATPTGKASIDTSDASQLYDAKEHKKSTLVAGTTILEVNGDDVFAVAIKIGSNTSKGELLRDIFFRKGSLFKLNVEMSLVLCILVVMAIANALVVTRGTLSGAPFAYSFFFAAYVVYATIPVLLPTVFVASTGISIDRLHKKKIICSNSDSLMLAGKVQRAYWDKTGTLTKQGLEFLHSDCYEKGQVVEERTDIMQKAMATCHTLTKTKSGECIGHFVDRQMFLASSSDMTQSEDGGITVRSKGGHIIQVIARHEFDHHRMTQSVVVGEVDDEGEDLVIVKGSPEAMKNQCLADSLPSDYDDVVRSRSKQGEYQLAVGYKRLQIKGLNDIGEMNRDDMESNLSFVGIVGFKNLIREETSDVIQQLREGDVASVIVTGDSTHTGIKIARESGIVEENATVVVGQSVGGDGVIEWLDAESDERVPLPSEYQLEVGSHVLAVNGDVWEHLLHSKLAHVYEKYVAVFGRCSPGIKVSVVDYAVRQGIITCFCGDGGNDCGALKSASIGIALSDAEASIVSPFTSLDKSPRDVVTVLREGRCCLSNSFASYKFMIIYGQIKVYMNFAVTAFSVNFGLWNWFFLDGIWLVTLAFSLPLSRAARKLAPERPTSSLLGVYTMTSALGVLFIHVLFAVGALLMLTGQNWYSCRKWDSTDVSNVRVIGDNYESEVIWLVSGYQYISTAFAYGLGYKFRMVIWRNYVLIMFIIVWTVIHFYIILNPSELSCLWRVNCNNEDVVRGVFEPSPVPIQNAFNTTEMPREFQAALLGIIVANTIAVIGWEGLIINTIMRGKARRRKEVARKAVLDGLRHNNENI